MGTLNPTHSLTHSLIAIFSLRTSTWNHMLYFSQMSATESNGSKEPRTVVPAVAATRNGNPPSDKLFAIFSSRSDMIIFPLHNHVTDSVRIFRRYADSVTRLLFIDVNTSCFLVCVWHSAGTRDRERSRVRRQLSLPSLRGQLMSSSLCKWVTEVTTRRESNLVRRPQHSVGWNLWIGECERSWAGRKTLFLYLHSHLPFSASCTT